MAGCSAAKIHQHLDFEHCFGASGRKMNQEKSQ